MVGTKEKQVNIKGSIKRLNFKSFIINKIDIFQVRKPKIVEKRRKY